MISVLVLLAAAQAAKPEPALAAPVIAPAPSVATADPSRPRLPLRSRVRPIGPFSTWFSRGDYPASALHRREEGTTRFRVWVEPNGRVSRCEVQVTSGSPALDDATCQILRRRARFTPAVDIEGNAAADHYFGGIGWDLDGAVVDVAWAPPQIVPVAPVRAPPIGATRGAAPASSQAAAVPTRPLQSLISMDDYPATALRDRDEGRTSFRLAVGADGRVTGCVILGSSGSSALDAATCRIVRARGRFTPARDASGRPVEDTYFGTLDWRIQR